MYLFIIKTQIFTARPVCGCTIGYARETYIVDVVDVVSFSVLYIVVF